MQITMITGNLTSDPQNRVTQSGKNVTSFTVAVNGRRKEDAPSYYRVTAWEKLAEHCGKYLSKGRKVYVSGIASASAYLDKGSNKPRATLELTAHEVEFLSPGGQQNQQPVSNADGFTQVASDELPF